MRKPADTKANPSVRLDRLASHIKVTKWMYSAILALTIVIALKIFLS